MGFDARMHDADADMAPPASGRDAIDQMFLAAYDDLRRIARARLRKSGTLTLLDTTTLVHECYLRISRTGPDELSVEAEFLAYASSVMRSVIVDVVRKRLAQRRGSGGTHVELDEQRAAAPKPEQQILDTHEAITSLATVEPRLAKVVEMRYFGGFTDAEVARSLGVTDRTVRRDLEKARDLLKVALGSGA
jgi:RNA polymerase sigma factor (TIGR02999 family)